MKTSFGSRRQLYLLLGLAAFLVLVVRWRSAPSSPAVPGARSSSGPVVPGEEAPGATSARPRARASQKVLNPEDVPIVSRKDFEGWDRREAPGPRNPFDQRPPTPVPPPTPTPGLPPAPAPGSPNFIGALPPPPPTPTPAPPDIPFKFIGTFGPKDRPFAVLVMGDQILNARSGDTVFERFKLRRVGYESVDIGFVGFPETEQRRLGIAP